MEVLALVIVLAVVVGLIGMAISTSNAKAREREAQKRRERAEEQRVKECGEMVLFFANHLGYIARQCISREELGKLIDQGMSANELGKEIGRRIQEMDGLVLGYQPLEDAKVPVKLTQEFRDRHVYVIGKSGAGKTNLLRTMIFQDMEAGNGIGVIAPEQEMLTEEILPFIPDERLDDVIYFNPGDTDSPVSFNPLHLDEAEEIDIKVDEVLTIFKRVIGDTGPRMDEILRQALYSLIGRPGTTLLDIERLLDRTDPGLRNEISRTAEPRLAHFWKEVYPSFPKDAHLPITNRLGRFLHPKSVRNILCNPGHSLNFRQAMDDGKIMLFNLSDGILGEQNSQLLGQLVVSKFQLAVMSRAKQPKARRRNFYLYIDEFQTFTGTAGASYEKILSRARKYKLGLILAHQQTGQISGSLLKEIMGNVSTSICFLVSREDALKFSREFVTEYNGEILNIPEEEILRLKVGQAYCKMGQHAFLMHTYLANQEGSGKRAQYIMDRARRNYGRQLPSPALGLTAAANVAGAGKAEGQTPAVPSGSDVLEGLDPFQIF